MNIISMGYSPRHCINRLNRICFVNLVISPAIINIRLCLSTSGMYIIQHGKIKTVSVMNKKENERSNCNCNESLIKMRDHTAWATM